MMCVGGALLLIFFQPPYLTRYVNTGYTQKNGEVSKVNNNLFLTLHAHKVHRQQWQLS
jgi:hypothetical protein